MSLPVAIAAIVLADVALIALLTFVMSRARLLRPHSTAAAEPALREHATWPGRAPTRRAPARASAAVVNA